MRESNEPFTLTDSNWYKLTLECGHEVYTKVRLRYYHSRNVHFVKCPQGPHDRPPEWKQVTQAEAVTDEQVSDVLSGNAFILPNRLLRTDGFDRAGKVLNSGNPFPYTTKDRDY